jgi:hypothetical protein
MLNAHFQNSMMEMLNQKDSIGERFDRGFARGQKIAASTIVPLIGALTHKGGMAMGLNEASNNLKAHADADMAATGSHKAQRNQLLMQMANMWQTMDPNSQKNLLALSTENLRQRKESEAEHRALQKDFLTAAAQHNNMSLQGAKMRVRQDQNDIKNDQVDRRLDSTKKNTTSQIDRRAAQTKNDGEKLILSKNSGVRADKNLAVQQGYLGLAGRASNRADAKAKTDLVSKGEKMSLAKSEAERKGNVAAANMLNGLAKTAGAVDQNGKLKDPNALERFSNPFYQKVMQSVIDKSSLKGTTAADLLPALAPKPKAAAAASGPGGGGLDLLTKAAGAIGDKLTGKTGASSGPRFADPHEAAAAYVAEFGKKPTPDELKKYAGVK